MNKHSPSSQCGGEKDTARVGQLRRAYQTYTVCVALVQVTSKNINYSKEEGIRMSTASFSVSNRRRESHAGMRSSLYCTT